MGTLSLNRLAGLAGRIVIEAFDAYSSRYRRITQQAAVRFANAESEGFHQDNIDRLELYRESLDVTVTKLRGVLTDGIDDRLLWSNIKAVYSALVAERPDAELGETFFNSVSRRIFSTRGVDPRIEFIDSDFSSTTSAYAPIRSFGAESSTAKVIRRVLTHYGLDFSDSGEASEEIGRRIDARLSEARQFAHLERIEVFDALFYRGLRAHLVARLCSEHQVIPLVVVARSSSSEPGIEAVLLHENDVSILFSYTRAHFFVDSEKPRDAVSFLRSILPKKRIAELYNAIGCEKHGKTEFYRELRRWLKSSSERLKFAPGTPGLVMVAFVLPGYDAIFKVIRDRFAPPKVTNRAKVIEKYHFVRHHDRAGRLVEAQDFQHLAFTCERFDGDLLEELRTQCRGSVSIRDGRLLLDHVYVERRVTPLNVFLESAPRDEACRVIVDFGQAIRDLAYTNVFPGDLLTKNFGVTRNGRVVFYDYDELVLLQDCHFRRIPPPRSEEDEYSSEPWYHVGDSDIFPEELKTFLGIPRRFMAVFEREHGVLFEADYWQDLQRQVSEGKAPSVQPFSHRCLLGDAEYRF